MKQEVLYSFSVDVLDFNYINDSLHALNLVLQEQSIPQVLKRSLYMIAVEGIDNMYKHGVDSSTVPFTFSVLYGNSQFELLFSHAIEKQQQPKLETYLRFLQQLSADELKKHYVSVVNTQKKTDKGGAGLGLLIMKRKSNTPFDFSFEDISKKNTIFTLKITISLDAMKIYRIQATKHTPFVQFDLKQEKLIISGQSRPENADEFYSILCAWIKNQEEYFKAMKHPYLKVDLEYYNSSSLKNIVRLIKSIIEHTQDALTIEWCYESDDDLAHEEAVEISEIVKKDFILTEK